MNDENGGNIVGGGGEGLDTDSMKDTEAVEFYDLLTEKAKEVGIKDGSHLMVLIRWNGFLVRPFNKQDNTDEIKVESEESDRFHFWQVEFEVLMEHPELREKVCTRGRMLVVIGAA